MQICPGFWFPLLLLTVFVPSLAYAQKAVVSSLVSAKVQSGAHIYFDSKKNILLAEGNGVSDTAFWVSRRERRMQPQIDMEDQVRKNDPLKPHIFQASYAEATIIVMY